MGSPASGRRLSARSRPPEHWVEAWRQRIDQALARDYLLDPDPDGYGTSPVNNVGESCSRQLLWRERDRCRKSLSIVRAGLPNPAAEGHIDT